MHKSNQCSVKQALIKLVAPVAIAAVTAFLCQPLYTAGGKCDYCILALLIGIPFGIQKMTLWFVPFGYGIAGTVAMFAFDILIGGLIGFFVFAYRIISGILLLTTAVIRLLIRK